MERFNLFEHLFGIDIYAPKTSYPIKGEIIINPSINPQTADLFAQIDARWDLLEELHGKD